MPENQEISNTMEVIQRQQWLFLGLGSC